MRIRPEILLLFVAVLGRAAFLSGLPAQDSVSTLHQEAYEAQQKGDFETALQKYGRLVQLGPSVAELHANLGLIHYKLGHQKEAETAFRKALSLKPDLAGVDLHLGILVFKQGRYQEALTYLKKAENAEPAHPQVLLFLGYVYFAQSDYATAARYFERRSEAEDPPELDYYLSRCYSGLAASFHARLQEEFPGSFYAHLARAHFYLAQANWEKGQEAYEAALKQRPDNVQLRARWQWLAEREGADPAWFASDRDFELIDGVTRFLQSLPEPCKIDEELHFYRERTRAFREDAPHSDKELYLLAEGYQILAVLTSHKLESGPHPFQAHLLRAQLNEELGDVEGAVREYHKALELKPNLGTIHLSIGNLYWEIQRYDEALAALQKGIERESATPLTFYQMGDILLLRGELEKAQAHLSQALALDPEMVEAHLAMERISSLKGDYEESLKHLKAAVRLRPNDPQVHYRLSEVYRNLGRATDAERELDLFRDLNAAQKEP